MLLILFNPTKRYSIIMYYLIVIVYVVKCSKTWIGPVFEELKCISHTKSLTIKQSIGDNRSPENFSNPYFDTANARYKETNSERDKQLDILRVNIYDRHGRNRKEITMADHKTGPETWKWIPRFSFSGSMFSRTETKIYNIQL